MSQNLKNLKNLKIQKNNRLHDRVVKHEIGLTFGGEGRNGKHGRFKHISVKFHHYTCIWFQPQHSTCHSCIQCFTFFAFAFAAGDGGGGAAAGGAAGINVTVLIIIQWLVAIYKENNIQG